MIRSLKDKIVQNIDQTMCWFWVDPFKIINRMIFRSACQPVYALLLGLLNELAEPASDQARR
ncbi:hypothetical protein HanIR_Chr04g0159541 [Helianthus annuus]|nr:hypothetical protein HanIR_Chr04g0159541 [Helianthus annuus]